jgi:hypothetical protein
MDNLEKYIKDNLSAFNTETPQASVWHAIEKGIEATDNVENFIKNHRTAFDTEIPRANVWAAIENQLGTTDNIETFIRTNREAFDTEIPSLKVWHNVAADLSAENVAANKFADKVISADKSTATKVVRITWWKQAAVAVALLVFGVMVGFLLKGEKADNIIAQATEQVAPELQEAENFYNQKVQSKYTQLASFNPDPAVMADLKQIDEVQEELRAELQNAPNSTKEEIIRRLIENYQIKLGILERVLNHINEQPLDNQKSQQQHESI